MIGAIIIFIIGFSFRVLHLPGADQLILLAIGLLILSLLANAIYVYRHPSGEGNLVTFLHEKYTPGIERFFLLLLIPLSIYKVVSILNDSADFVVIFGAGLQFIALCWRTIETDLSRRNPFALTAVLISGFCLTIVFLGPLLPLSLRIVLIALYSVTSGWLAFRMESEPGKISASMFLALAPAVFLVWVLVRLNLMPLSTGHLFFNIPVLILLLIGLFLCRRGGTMRTYMLVSVASYLFEYTS